MTDTASQYGYGLSCTYCTAILPQWDPVTLSVYYSAVTAIQPPLGLGTSTTTGKLLPSCVSGRAMLAESIIRRLSTSRGGLPDTKIPTTTGNYGIELLDYIGADMTPTDAAMLSAAIDAQIRQEERAISSTTKSVLFDSTLMVSIAIVDAQGPFKLTLSIDVLTGDLSVLSSPQ